MRKVVFVVTTQSLLVRAIAKRLPKSMPNVTLSSRLHEGVWLRGTCCNKMEGLRMGLLET